MLVLAPQLPQQHYRLMALYPFQQEPPVEIFTLLASDYLVINTGAAATWTWPLTPTNGRILMIVNQGTGAITTSVAYRTASGPTTSTIALATSVQLVYDGTQWRKIN